MGRLAPRTSGTAILRLGFSVTFVAIYWALGQPLLALLQSGHLVSSIVVLLLWAPAGARTWLGRASRGAAAAYYRTLSDVVQCALAVHATGGLDSPLLVGVAAPVVFSALGRDPWRARVAAAVAVALAVGSEAVSSFGSFGDINLFGRGPTPSSVGQIALVGSFLGLALVTLSEVLHKLYASGVRAREQAEEATASAQVERDRAELAREETERIAALAREANASSGLDGVLSVVASFAREELRANRFFFLMVNDAQTELSAQSYVRDGKFVPLDEIPIVLRHVPLIASSGTLHRTFRKKKLLYLHGVQELPVGPIDEQLIRTFAPEWMAQLPLVLGDKVVAIVAMSGLGRSRIARYHLHLLERMALQVVGSVERARLLRATEEAHLRTEASRRELEKLNEFSKRMNATTDLTQIVDSVFRYLTDTYGFDGHILMTPEASSSGTRLRVWRQYDTGRPPAVHEYSMGLNILLDGTGGIIERAFARGKPLFIADVEADIFRRPYPGMEQDRERIERLMLRGFLLLPLVVQGEPVALILCGSSNALELDRAQRASIARFAEQIAGAFHTAELLTKVQEERDRAELLRREAERAREETAAFSAFARRINEQTDANLEDLLGQVFAFIAGNFGIANGVLSLVDKDRGVLCFANEWHAPGRLNADQAAFIKELQVPLGPAGGALARTCRRKRPLYLPRVPPADNAIDSDLLRVLELKSLLHIPLVVRDESIGVIWCDAPKVKGQTARASIVRLETFAAQVAGAVHNAQLLKEAAAARHQAERARLETQKLAEYAKRINETSDLNQILDEIFAHIAANFGARDIVLQLVDEEHQELRTIRCTTDRGPADVEFAMNLRIPLNEKSGTLFRTFQKKKPFYAPRIVGFPSDLDRKIVETLQFDSLAQFPLVIQQETIGMLWLSFGKQRQPKAVIESIARMCEQIAGALRAAELLREAQAARTESEKARTEIQTLADLARQVNDATDFDGILAALAALLLERYGANMVTLWTSDPSSGLLFFRSHCVEGRPFAMNELPEVMAHGIAESKLGPSVRRVLKRGKSVFIPRIDPDFVASSPVDAAIMERWPMTWNVQVPLSCDGRVIGLFSFTGPESARGAGRDLRFLERVGAQVAGMVLTVELLKQTEEARGDIERMAEVTRRLNENTDVSAIAEGVFEYLKDRFDLGESVLLLVDEGARKIRAGAISGTSKAHAFWNRLAVPLAPETGSLFRTYQRQKPLHIRRIPDLEPGTLDAEIVAANELTSFLQIPLVVQEKTVGIVVSVPRRPLRAKQLEAIARMCDQISGAVRNARLLEDSRLARSESEIARRKSEQLADMSRRLNETTDLQVIADDVLGFLLKEYKLEKAVLLLVDQSARWLEMVAHTSLSPAEAAWGRSFRPALEPQTGSLYRTFVTQKTLYLNRIAGRYESQVDRDIVETLKLESFVHLPLVVQGKTVGIIFTQRSRLEPPLKRAALRSMQAFADQTAGAVRTSQLLAHVEEARRLADGERARAEQAREETEILAALSRKVTEGRSLDEILVAAMDVLRSLYEANSLAVYMVDSEARALEMRASFVDGESKAMSSYDDLLRHVPLVPESGTMFRAVQKRRLFHTNRVDPRWLDHSPVDRAATQAFGFSWFVHVPLVVDQDVVGLFSFTGNRERRLTKGDLEFVERIGGQMAGAVRTAELLQQTEVARAESDRLLTSILPARVAAELKRSGHVEPLFYDAVTVLFTDFVGFTQASQRMMPDELVQELDGCFSQFDEVVIRNNLEKLKTIGDAYMCAAGLPAMNQTHPVDACLTALELRAFMAQMGEIKRALGVDYWQIRIGIHSGPVTAGVIGTSKFAYDIWGDTVNTASRMESSGAPGQVNISGATYELVKDFFVCEYRGKVTAKGKGELDMYFLERIRPELSADTLGLAPNADFRSRRQEMEFGAVVSEAAGTDEYTL